jgi:hypothetical protein
LFGAAQAARKLKTNSALASTDDKICSAQALSKFAVDRQLWDTWGVKATFNKKRLPNVSHEEEKG